MTIVQAVGGQSDALGASNPSGALLQWNAGYTVTVTNARFERNHSGNNSGGLYVSGSPAR